MQIKPEVLDSLGITKEDVIKAYVSEYAKALEDRDLDTDFIRECNKVYKEAVNSAIDRLASERINKFIDDIIEHNMIALYDKFGKPISEKMTLNEYLEKRLLEYCNDGVNGSGDDESTCNAKRTTYYNHTTRLKYLVDSRLKERLDNTLKESVVAIYKELSKQITESIKDSLDVLSKKVGLKISL